MDLRFLVLTVPLCLLGGNVRADDVGCTSTTFHLFSPNDKVCVQAFDDPRVPGVTCHISQAKTGGWKGAIGIAEDPSRFSIACHQTGPISLPDGLPRTPAGFAAALLLRGDTPNSPTAGHVARASGTRARFRVAQPVSVRPRE